MRGAGGGRQRRPVAAPVGELAPVAPGTDLAGPSGDADQGMLAESADPNRRRRLAEAVRQARAIAGKDAVLRVLAVDSESRVPERRTLLTPYTEGGE